MIQSRRTDKVYDTAIIGGGVLGLWAARHAIKRGEKVALIEKRQIGAGASGGFLGALMPHMPDGWDAKKQFQYEGLTTLREAVDVLKAETGIDCGYKMCGRIMPLPHEKMLQHMPVRTSGAAKYWGEGLDMNLLSDQGGEWFDAGWVNPERAKFGIQHDTFSARINPRAYLVALETYVRPRIEVLEGVEVISLTLRQAQDEGGVMLSSGETLHAAKIIVANGWEAYSLLQPFMGDLNAGKPIGRGVKGQAVVVEFAHNDDLPIVYHDGTYVVPHKGNRVAIGSTSRNAWTGEPNAFDQQDMEFYEKAVQLVPALKNAPIVGRWAGVRPRNTIDGRGTDPWFGPVPGGENLIALIGGFKITFGVGHLDFCGDDRFVQ